MSAIATRQRFQALENANEVRSSLRLWKLEMAARPHHQAIQEAARILRDDPESVGGLSIHSFLVAIPRIGEAKAQRLLTNRAEGSYIWPFRRVRALTDRERRRLCELLMKGG